MNNTKRNDLFYYIGYSLLCVVLTLSCAEGIIFEGLSLPLWEELLLFGIIIYLLIIIFVLLRGYGQRHAIHKHQAGTLSGVKPVVKRRGFFIREILPFIGIYALTVLCIALFRVFFFQEEANSFQSVKTTFLSVSWLYDYYLQGASYLLGDAADTVFYANALLRLLSILSMYGMIHHLYSKRAALWSALLLNLVPYFYLNLGKADEGMGYLFLLSVFLFLISSLTSQTHICQRKAGFLLFVFWGLAFGALLFLDVSFGYFFILGLFMLSYHKDFSRWKISKKCMWLYGPSFVVSAACVLLIRHFLMGGIDLGAIILPQFVPFPSYLCGVLIFDMIPLLLMTLPIFLQPGNSFRILPLLTVISFGYMVMAGLGFMPGDNLHVLLSVSCLCVGCGIAMLSDMSYPMFEKAAKKTPMSAKEAEDNLIEELVGRKKEKDKPKAVFTYPIEIEPNADYDISIQDGDDYDIKF